MDVACPVVQEMLKDIVRDPFSTKMSFHLTPPNADWFAKTSSTKTRNWTSLSCAASHSRRTRLVCHSASSSKLGLTPHADEWKYCLVKDKEAFLKELDKEPGNRTAFVAKREEEIKVRKEVCLRSCTSLA